MKIIINRDLNTERNKDQEDLFESTMNHGLYFDSNSTITKIDGWKFSNVKKLCEILKENWLVDELIIEYNNWNKNVFYIYNELPVFTGKELLTLSDQEKNLFINNDVDAVHHLIKEYKEDDNKKLAIIFFVLEITKDIELIEIINTIINKGISNINLALTIVINKFLLEVTNE